MKPFLAWFGLWLASPALSDDGRFVLTSASPGTSYGVLVAAPQADCAAARVVVRAAGRSWRSSTLAPGEQAVIRLGRGFEPGAHPATVEVLGCDQPARALRRVTLAKSSPDHGWRGGGLE
jgi:hypothetical protein